SSAVGYFGTPSGPTPDTTPGDITKMWIEFDVYPQSSCGSGTPIATPRAQVADTGAVGDGVGTANTVYTSLSEASYCVVAVLVAGGSGTTTPSQYYMAPDADISVVTFYDNTGQF